MHYICELLLHVCPKLKSQTGNTIPATNVMHSAPKVVL